MPVLLYKISKENKYYWMEGTWDDFVKTKTKLKKEDNGKWEKLEKILNT